MICPQPPSLGSLSCKPQRIDIRADTTNGKAELAIAATASDMQADAQLHQTAPSSIRHVSKMHLR